MPTSLVCALPALKQSTVWFYFIEIHKRDPWCRGELLPSEMDAGQVNVFAA
jgi:hypothetical protein